MFCLYQLRYIYDPDQWQWYRSLPSFVDKLPNQLPVFSSLLHVSFPKTYQHVVLASCSKELAERTGPQTLYWIGLVWTQHLGEHVLEDWEHHACEILLGVAAWPEVSESAHQWRPVLQNKHFQEAFESKSNLHCCTVTKWLIIPVYLSV